MSVGCYIPCSLHHFSNGYYEQLLYATQASTSYNRDILQRIIEWDQNIKSTPATLSYEAVGSSSDVVGRGMSKWTRAILLMMSVR